MRIRFDCVVGGIGIEVYHTSPLDILKYEPHAGIVKVNCTAVGDAGRRGLFVRLGLEQVFEL